MSYLLRLFFCASLLGCGGAPLVSMNPANAAETAPSDNQTLTLQVGRPMTLTQQGLTVEFVEFTDSRCPVGTHCVWAGHATATLRISRPGVPTESIVIGTQAPPAMQLPYQAVSGAYLFTLMALEPAPREKTTVPKDAVRATVLLQKQ